LQAQIQSKSLELEAEQRETAQLKIKNTQLTEEVGKEKQKVTDAKQEAEATLTKLTSKHEVAIKEKDSQLETAQQQLKTEQAARQQAENALSLAQTQSSEATQAVARLTEQLKKSTSTEETAVLKQQLQQKTNELAEATRKTAAAEQQIAKLKENHNLEITEKDRQLKTAEEKIKQEQTNNEHLTQQLTETTRHLKTITLELEKTKQTLSEQLEKSKKLESTIQEISLKAEKTAQDLKTAQTTNKSNRTELFLLKSKQKTLTLQAKLADDRLQESQKIAQQLQQNNVELTSKLKESDAIKAVLIRDLKKQAPSTLTNTDSTTTTSTHKRRLQDRS